MAQLPAGNVPLIKSLLQWLRPELGGKDALAGWGVDFYSGRAVGNHYAANDMTLFKLAVHYTQQTADFGFLDEQVAGRPVWDWLEPHTPRRRW